MKEALQQEAQRQATAWRLAMALYIGNNDYHIVPAFAEFDYHGYTREVFEPEETNNSVA